MLNTDSDVTAAADARFGFGMGVFPLTGARTVVPSSTRAVIARPRAHWAANMQVATTQQPYYAPKALIAAARGGDPGTHPAREPV